MHAMAAHARPAVPRTPARPGWLRGWAVALCLAGLLGGCISTKFIYNQLDWLIVWYLDDFFTLNDEQEAELRRMVTRNLDWVRRAQLPAYAALLRAVEADAGAGRLDADTLELRYQAMLGLWDEFLRHVTPDAVAFLRGLDDQQVGDFIANVDEHNEELWEDFAGESPAERRERREKTAIRGLQRFTGRLSGEQKDLVRRYTDRMYDNSGEWLEGRRDWQQRFHDLVRERPPAAAFTARLQDLLLNPNAADSPAYRRQTEANRRLGFEMVAAVIGQLSERQARRFSQRMLGYAEDFERLASQPAANPPG